MLVEDVHLRVKRTFPVMIIGGPDDPNGTDSTGLIRSHFDFLESKLEAAFVEVVVPQDQGVAGFQRLALFLCQIMFHVFPFRLNHGLRLGVE